MMKNLSILFLLASLCRSSIQMANPMDCPKVEPMEDIKVANITGDWYLIATANSPLKIPDFSGTGDQLVAATCPKFTINLEDPLLTYKEQWISCDNKSINFTYTANVEGNCDGYFYPPETEVDELEVFGHKLKKIVKPVGVVLFTDYDRLLVTYIYYRVNSWFSMTQCYRTAAVFVRNRTLDAFSEIYPRLTPLSQLGFDLGQLNLIKNDQTCWNN
jgi:hypothetical protein